MATNRTLIATKNRLLHSLNNTRLTLSTRPSCPCHQSYRRLHFHQHRNPTSSSVAVVGGGAHFSTSSIASKPTTSAPVASPAVPSTPCSASAVSVRKGGPASNARVNEATAAAVVNSRPAIAAALPFSYDPTGLSGQAAKKPSCDNLNLKNSFYRRKLPEHLVSFTSPKGKQLFREMLSEGYGEGYFSLVGNFTTQSEPAYCGPSSLAMVLNSLEVDPQRQWKGAWRWYSDELLECCAPAEQVKAKGITFNQFACLSKCHCDVQVRRANQVSLEQFKQDLEMVCSRDDIHMVVSFSRKALGQTGDGHFSPIGGYVPKAGMVLVLDTARFKYPSYFVSVEKLWESLFPIDAETGSSRGYFLLSANPNQPAISLCKIPKTASSTLAATAKDLEKLNLNSTGTVAAPSAEGVLRDAKNATAASLDDSKAASASAATTTPASTCSSGAATLSNTSAHTIDNKMSWTSLAQTFCKDLPSRIQIENPQTLNRMISVVLQGVPREYAFWISQQQAHRLRDTTELIESIRSTKLYSLVSTAFPAPVFAGEDSQSQEARLARQQHEGALVFGTLFLMSSPSTLFLTLPSEVSREFEQLRTVALESNGVDEHRVLKEEVERMRLGIVDLVNSFCCCGTKTTAAPEGTA
ncbi:Phytochelatin-domain-containing protein [Linnemannia elongata AG-77]|uniref:glutathione gamma-glutamylcysteinyltransferase n=1 Tax=Linnemannia elongata AG-77 TaxID=1314771 RepID=A0A197JIV8_9FUNG|nr:Phytochelatin-domain-containing protein [Linnemannia elongata AG-77]